MNEVLKKTVNLSSWFPVFVLIILLIVAAIFTTVHMNGLSKASFDFVVMLTGEYRIESVC